MEEEDMQCVHCVLTSLKFPISAKKAALLLEPRNGPDFDAIKQLLELYLEKCVEYRFCMKFGNKYYKVKDLLLEVAEDAIKHGLLSPKFFEEETTETANELNNDVEMVANDGQ